MPWFWQEPDAPRRSVTSSSDDFGRKSTTSDISEDHAAVGTWLSPSSLIHPSTVISAALLTGAVFSANHVYKTYLRRIPNVSHLKPAFFRTRSAFGRVTRVGDADNFRLYHTPGGRLLGWNWAREVPSLNKDLVDQTLHIRIAGIDAPELPHFGQPGQKYGPPAMDWLKKQVDGKDVRVYPYARDQYNRVVASVKIRRWWGIPGLGTKDLGLEMIRAGWAVVYVNKGAEYGDMKQAYLDAEKYARSHHLGQWGESRTIWEKLGLSSNDKVSSSEEESPGAFKARMARGDVVMDRKKIDKKDNRKNGKKKNNNNNNKKDDSEDENRDQGQDDNATPKNT